MIIYGHQLKRTMLAAGHTAPGSVPLDGSLMLTPFGMNVMTQAFTSGFAS